MKLLQRFLIITILILPVILGIFLLAGAHSPIPSASLKRIGLIKVDGVILNSENIVKQLNSFRNDKTIVGILLKIDSPGGATAPSQEIYREILRFKEAGKPVVVSMGSVAASGGYYIASPARCIYASPGTLTGSIGVILTIPLYKDLANKIGVQMRTLKAGKFKDIANRYRSMSDGETLIIQSLLDDTHNQFIDDVARAREISRDSIKAIADGRIFTGKQAKGLGLVDSLGGYLDA
ncbi:MAG TPA: signal peptide peptidase SppA, partial [Chitinispirillaceae bacterium]|nr:signal peptide peptidase SppA [Chitinispirillaceae bacterium]